MKVLGKILGYEIKLNSKLALLSFCEKGELKKITSFHFGVKPEDNCVYKYRKGHEYEVSCQYIWGYAVEPYEHCLRYFGLGPLFLICWR